MRYLSKMSNVTVNIVEEEQILKRKEMNKQEEEVRKRSVEIMSDHMVKTSRVIAPRG